MNHQQQNINQGSGVRFLEEDGADAFWEELVASTLYPKPQTPNPKPQTLNPQLQTPHPKPKPQLLNQEEEASEDSGLEGEEVLKAVVLQRCLSAMKQSRIVAQ